MFPCGGGGLIIIVVGLCVCLFIELCKTIEPQVVRFGDSVVWTPGTMYGSLSAGRSTFRWRYVPACQPILDV